MPIDLVEDLPDYPPFIRLNSKYKEEVQVFYEKGYREVLEKIAEEESDRFGKIELRWEEERGLVKIFRGTHSAYVLDENQRFLFHNSEHKETQELFSKIAQKYVELLEE